VFGLDPTKMDSPGDQIHRLLGHELFAYFISTDEKVSPAVSSDLLALENAFKAYKREVGPDPVAYVTIDHPKWQEIRQLARTVISSARQCGFPTW
jgi:hypothetical protein